MTQREAVVPHRLVRLFRKVAGFMKLTVKVAQITTTGSPARRGINSEKWSSGRGTVFRRTTNQPHTTETEKTMKKPASQLNKGERLVISSPYQSLLTGTVKAISLIGDRIAVAVATVENGRFDEIEIRDFAADEPVKIEIQS